MDKKKPRMWEQLSLMERSSCIFHSPPRYKRLMCTKNSWTVYLMDSIYGLICNLKYILQLGGGGGVFGRRNIHWDCLWTSNLRLINNNCGVNLFEKMLTTGSVLLVSSIILICLGWLMTNKLFIFFSSLLIIGKIENGTNWCLLWAPFEGFCSSYGVDTQCDLRKSSVLRVFNRTRDHITQACTYKGT